jgi:hypothetical protein
MLNLFVSLADSFSKHWFSAGNDPEQNRYNGEDEKNVNQAARSAGDESQYPQDDQDDCKRV